MADLATQFVNAQGLLGRSIRIPSENASDEDRAAFRQRLQEAAPGLVEAPDTPEAIAALQRHLGAPEEASGYRLPEVDGEHLAPVPGFNDWAHEAGLTQGQFETIAKRFTEAQVQAGGEKLAAHQEAMKRLADEWGYAYDAKRDAAIGAARLTGAPDDFIEALEGDKVPATWVRFFASLSERFGEADIGDTTATERGSELTPAEAQAQLNEVMGNRQHDYWTALPGTPEKEMAMALVMRLRHRAMGKSGRTDAVTLGQAEETELG